MQLCRGSRAARRLSDQRQVWLCAARAIRFRIAKRKLASGTRSRRL
jgi:hypothetical protein